MNPVSFFGTVITAGILLAVWFAFPRFRPFFYALAVVGLLVMCTGCGGGGSSAPAAASPAPLHTARTLVVGGDEAYGLTWPCVDNRAVRDGDSVTTLGVFQTGALNGYPGTVVIVASAIDGPGALDNYTGAVVHAVASGARTTLVGVFGADEFNTQLRAVARAYGAAYSDSLDVRCPE